MQYEVELKFPVDDLGRLEKELNALKAEWKNVQTEIDSYFAHPSRDFSVTDEALRIRSRGEKNFITYKGPKIDATTKTRRELDILLRDGAEVGPLFRELLEALGFRLVSDVRKNRRKAFLMWGERRVECSLDDVEGVGTYCELELIAEESGVNAAREILVSLAARLGLCDAERRSYLELQLNCNQAK